MSDHEGGPSMQNMPYMNNGWPPCMQMMGIPNQMAPMVAMPEQQLEAMYPDEYHIIYPAVKSHCDAMNTTYGIEHIPTPEQMKAMVEDIVQKVEKDVETVVKKGAGAEGDRQFGFPARRLLGGLAGILLIRELIDRRRFPYYGGVPFYGVPQYGGPFFGTPFYGGGYVY